MTDAYSYLRFSSSKQASGDSVRRQTKLAREYCETHGLTLRDEFTYQDLGVSAYKGDNAKTGHLADFLKAVERGQVKKGSYLLVESLDRISRAASHVAAGLLTDLVEADITVVTLLDEHVWDKKKHWEYCRLSIQRSSFCPRTRRKPAQKQTTNEAL
jgi:DNA invertase Pin-like site-specific DNA recombinase